MRSTFIPFFLFATLILTGCSQNELYSGLHEKEANTMIAILERNGISASKASGAEETFIVNVDPRFFADAVEVLDNYGYPKDKFMGVGDTFKKSGLVSSPSEERIRYMYALAQDLQDTLCLISGVLNARVHVVIPNNDPLADQIYPSSASVFIKYRKNSGVESLAPQIKNLVVRSIEGLNYENVTLALFSVQENDVTAPAGETPFVDPARLKPDATPFVITVGLLLLLAIGAFFGYIHLSRKKLAQPNNTTNAG